MKKIAIATLLGGAIVTAGMALAPMASAATPDEYKGKTPGELVQMSVDRSVQTGVGTAQALPVLTKAFVNREDGTVKYIVGQINDAPQWAADPAIEAAAQVLPKPLGGTNGDPFTANGDGNLMQFRNTTMLKVRDANKTRALKNVDKAATVRDNIQNRLNKGDKS